MGIRSIGELSSALTSQTFSITWTETCARHESRPFRVGKRHGNAQARRGERSGSSGWQATIRNWASTADVGFGSLLTSETAQGRFPPNCEDRLLKSSNLLVLVSCCAQPRC